MPAWYKYSSSPVRNHCASCKSTNAANGTNKTLLVFIKMETKEWKYESIKRQRGVSIGFAAQLQLKVPSHVDFGARLPVTNRRLTCKYVMRFVRE